MIGFIAGVNPLINSCSKLSSESRTFKARNSIIVCSTASSKRALIVTNKGGGHGELGYHLCESLLKEGLTVDILNDNGGDSSKVVSKPPFSSYSELEKHGVGITFLDISDHSAIDNVFEKNEMSYDFIFDNQNVSQEFILQKAVSQNAFYAYVSSGGMYIPGDEFPMTESNPTKESTQRKHEELVLSDEFRSKLRGCAFFRPQYIVGPLTNKRDYLDWFFDRIVKGNPMLIPAPGTQRTTVTDARDVASMIASVVNYETAISEEEQKDKRLGPVFNCASDVYVTLRQIAVECGNACGKSEQEIDALIEYYEADKKPEGSKFPFRATNFDVGVEKAKSVLNWKPQYSSDFKALAKEYYEGYCALGLPK